MFIRDIYETGGGGLGGGPTQEGLSSVHSHMTNTLNTPIESLEMHYPLRVHRYAVRWGSGGVGHHSGGNGIVREYEFLQTTQLSLLSERRIFAPWGLQGGKDGDRGANFHNGQILPGKCAVEMAVGDRLTIQSPGAVSYTHLTLPTKA